MPIKSKLKFYLCLFHKNCFIATQKQKTIVILQYNIYHLQFIKSTNTANLGSLLV